jgi:hypothetical protein
MKIGIYTIHAVYNYGAMLQAYATQKFLANLGYDAELVYLNTKEQAKKNEHKYFALQLKPLVFFIYARISTNVRKNFQNFRKFHQTMRLSKIYTSEEELYNCPPQYDIHLVGSDQVWNLEKGFPKFPIYFLDFLQNKTIKISYASSFGTETINHRLYPQLKKYFESFHAISVREEDGVHIIKEATSINAQQVMDPTFLLDQQEWENLAGNKPLISGKYIFCYGFDRSPDTFSMINSIKEKLKLPIIAVASALFIPYKADKFYLQAGPIEFLNLIKYSHFVCTSSYHGIAFAIHFRKSFYSTIHPTRNSRMKTMLGNLGLENRQLSFPNQILQTKNDDLYIDYSQIEAKINQASKASKDWLYKQIMLYARD